MASVDTVLSHLNPAAAVFKPQSPPDVASTVCGDCVHWKPGDKTRLFADGTSLHLELQSEAANLIQKFVRERLLPHHEEEEEEPKPVVHTQDEQKPEEQMKEDELEKIWRPIRDGLIAQIPLDIVVPFCTATNADAMVNQLASMLRSLSNQLPAHVRAWICDRAMAEAQLILTQRCSNLTKDDCRNIYFTFGYRLESDGLCSWCRTSPCRCTLCPICRTCVDQYDVEQRKGHCEHCFHDELHLHDLPG